MSPLVIVGSGLAGYTLAREFRKLDPVTPLAIVTRDDGRAYSKPVLSNALAAGRDPSQIASADAAAMAAQLNALVRCGVRVSAIDRVRRQLHTDQGEIAYDRLVLAHGADPIALPLLGDAATAVMSVNDLADYTRFRRALPVRGRVLLLGAGLIGCEFANDLLAAGHTVTVVDPALLPLGRLLPGGVAQRFRDRLAAAGVQWRLGAVAERVDRVSDGAQGEVPDDAPDGALRVTLANGEAVLADVVLSAVGLRPRIALAGQAGLVVARGVVVDRHLRTSDPRIFALGDCAEVGGQLLPYVMPLMQGARALAATLAGRPTPVSYPAMPVTVKAPAAPLVVAPPPPGVEGQWQIEIHENDVEAQFVDPQGVLRGFALLGNATAQRMGFARRMPAVF